MLLREHTRPELGIIEPRLSSGAKAPIAIRKGIPSQRSRDFITLDGLRGIAAAAIVTRHSGEFWESITAYGRAPGSNGYLSATGPLFESYLAVDFFFVLSGFVLMHAYGRKLREGMSAAQFMRIRFVRLYPLYLLALALSLLPFVAAAIFGQQDVYRDGLPSVAIVAALAILMLPAPFSNLLFPLNIPAWSLFFELIGNAVFGVLGRHLTTRWLAVIVAGSALVLSYSVATERFGFGVAGAGAMNDGWYWSSFGAGVLRVLFSFFAGALVYRLWDERSYRIRVSPILIAGGLMLVFAVHPPAALERVYDLTATIIVFPAIVLIGASTKPEGYLARTFTALGLASYGVYVLQAPVNNAISMVLSNVPDPSSLLTPAGGVGFIFSLFLLALAADSFFDVPARRWLTARLGNTS